MSRIKLLREGVNAAPLYWALQSHPELWNQFKDRTESPASPHHGLDDIWVRFGSQANARDDKPHDAHWYEAADVLGVKQMCLDLMRHVEGVELGGVLITRIPPGAECRPHTDPGWHARRYDKFAIQVASAPGQRFCFEGESLETKPGDLFWFDNQFSHWVTNPTPYERVTLIVCIRMEGESCLG
jgi:quercetin dioxygenase-like cupin family protein